MSNQETSLPRLGDYLQRPPKARKVSETLLRHCLRVSKSYLYTWPERVLTPQEQACFEKLWQDYQKGTPMAYVLGQVEFYGLTLTINSNVLIPRPDSEVLIDCALALPDSKKAWKVADLGTGSGALALALAKARPQWQIVASDLCPKALHIAKKNAQTLQFKNVSFAQGDWDAAWPKDFSPDLIIANPPYLATHELHPDLTFEPTLALIAGETGLECYPTLVKLTTRQTKPCWLMVEHGFNQGEALRNLFEKYAIEQVSTHPDEAARERLTLGHWPGLLPYH